MGYARPWSDPRIVKSIGLWYDDLMNWFVDEDGFVVMHLWWYITPDQFLLFKHPGGKDMAFRCSTDITKMVELFWPKTFMIEMLKDAREHREKRMCPWFSDAQKQFHWERECRGLTSMGTEYLIEAGDILTPREEHPL